MLPRRNYGANPFGGSSPGPPAGNYNRGGSGNYGNFDAAPSYSQGPRFIRLQPAKNQGGNAFIFGNIVAVSPRDFPNASVDTLLELRHDGQSYVVTARAIPECRPGEIGLTEFHRAWMEISMGPDSFVEASLFTSPLGTQDPDALPYAGRVEIDISWARPNQTTENPFPQKELTERFLYVHENQVFHVGQPLVLNFKGMPNVVIRIVSIYPLDFGTEKPVPIRRGVASRNTEVVVRKSAPRLTGAEGPAQTNAILSSNFKFEELGIGGLDKEFNIIFRKAFGSRLLDPHVAAQLGLQHVRGMLLYGPPGTGKTLIARQIGKSLNTRPPKIINGPEILNKYVGQSEENVRKIFEDAEKEYKEKGDASGLHIIIFDELDAVCKQRGSGAGGNTGVGDTVVNQLLTKMDGVEQLNNILLIGMTNRKDMIDDALLRPGRMEIHLEISLPDEAGRLQILRIHTAKLRETDSLSPEVDLDDIARQTKNYSGAEIAGLIRSAASYAIYRATGGPSSQIKQIKDATQIIVTKKDFEDALEETTPMFGVSEEFLENALSFGIVHFNEHIGNILSTGKELANSFGEGVHLISVLLWGPIGSGKTALAARMALDSGAPFIQKITMNDFLGLTELQRIQAIDRVFRDADKSNMSVIIIDEIETLIDYVSVGPRFSVNMLGVFRALLTRDPPKGRKRIIIATTSERSELYKLNLVSRFSREIAVPNISDWNEFWGLMMASKLLSQDLAKAIFSAMRDKYGEYISVGVKYVMMAIVLASRMSNENAVDAFMNHLEGKLVLGGPSGDPNQFAFAS